MEHYAYSFALSLTGRYTKGIHRKLRKKTGADNYIPGSKSPAARPVGTDDLIQSSLRDFIHLQTAIPAPCAGLLS